MAIFDWTFAGSGAPGKYGRSTVGGIRVGSTRTYDRNGVITVVQPSGTNAYFTYLASRYLHNPSGWNS
jgi:hypothetical protein